MDGLFIPKWVEYQLQSEAHRSAEIQLHRDFFDAWEHLHSIPNDKLHRPKSEAAAQRLCEIAATIQRLREPPVQIERILNG